MNEMTGTEFFEYCKSFYGKGGLYELNYTKGQILKGINTYFKKTNEDYSWGGGDSLDRERVLMEMQRLFPKVENLEERV